MDVGDVYKHFEGINIYHQIAALPSDSTSCEPGFPSHTLQGHEGFGKVTATDDEKNRHQQETRTLLLQYIDSPDDLQKIALDHPYAPVGTFLLQNPSEELAALCLKNGQRFEDPFFPPTPEGFFLPEPSKRMQTRLSIRFKRLKSEDEYMKLFEKRGLKECTFERIGQPEKEVLPCNASAWEDVQQGEWGSCKLTSFISAMGLHEDEHHRRLLRHMFPVVSMQARSSGLHVVRVWCASLEAWRYCVLDDFKPKGMLGGSKRTGQLFYTLLEKVWIKTAGGFLIIEEVA